VAGIELQFLLAPIILVALIELWRLRRSGPAVAIRQFRIEADSPSGEFIYVLGRRTGVIAWVLGLFGLEPQASFSVTRDEVARETVGAFGFESLYAPIVKVSGSNCSYYRAFSVLILSIAFYVFGLMNVLISAANSNDYTQQNALQGSSRWLWISLVCGTLCYGWYVISKRVILTVRAAGPIDLGIAFKPGIIENVGLDLNRAMAAVDLINERLLAATGTLAG
jgi:hypothetical protein